MRMTHAEFAKLASERGIKIDNPLIDEGIASQTLTLPYPPSVNQYRTPVVINGRATLVLTKEGRQYKKTVAGLCLAARIKPMTGKLCVTFVASSPISIRDLDGCQKLLFDSLTGLMYEDDRQIYEIHAYKCVQRPASVSITVKRVDEIDAVK